MQPLLTVQFYRTTQGNEPVREWLKQLPHSERKAIGEDIKTVQYGWPLGMPLVRKMTPGLWEIRSTLKTGIARILFTVAGNTMVVLHGFIKQSQKTPDNELNTALRRMKEVHQHE